MARHGGGLTRGPRAQGPERQPSESRMDELVNPPDDSHREPAARVESRRGERGDLASCLRPDLDRHEEDCRGCQRESPDPGIRVLARRDDTSVSAQTPPPVTCPVPAAAPVRSQTPRVYQSNPASRMNPDGASRTGVTCAEPVRRAPLQLAQPAGW